MGGKIRRVAMVVFTLAFAAALALMASCAQSQVKSDEGSKGASSDSSEDVSAESASAASAQAGNLAKWIVDYNETIGVGNAVEAPNALTVQAGRTAQIPEVRIAEDGAMYQRTPEAGDTVSTAYKHIAHIYKKLNVSSQQELLVCMLK